MPPPYGGGGITIRAATYEQSARIKTWRDMVLAADARKAGNASNTQRLNPRPSSLTGKRGPKPLNTDHVWDSPTSQNT